VREGGLGAPIIIFVFNGKMHWIHGKPITNSSGTLDTFFTK
jgi:hypothetical protein